MFVCVIEIFEMRQSNCFSMRSLLISPQDLQLFIYARIIIYLYFLRMRDISAYWDLMRCIIAYYERYCRVCRRCSVRLLRQNACSRSIKLLMLIEGSCCVLNVILHCAVRLVLSQRCWDNLIYFSLNSARQVITYSWLVLLELVVRARPLSLSDSVG